MASRKRFQNDRALSQKEWNWDSALWRHCCFQNCCVSASVKVLDPTSYFTWEMAEELARCSAGTIHLFFFVFCPTAGLQPSIVKLKTVGTTSFLSTSWQSLKEGPNKFLTTRFCSKPSLVKCSAQTRECFEGVKHSLLGPGWTWKC